MIIDQINIPFSIVYRYVSESAAMIRVELCVRTVKQIVALIFLIFFYRLDFSAAFLPDKSPIIAGMSKRMNSITAIMAEMPANAKLIIPIVNQVDALILHSPAL